MPTLPDESVSDASSVELIERGPFELADSLTTEEPMQRGPVVGTKALVAVSIGLIVLAFAVMTRPGPEDRVVDEPPQTTVAPSTTAPPPPDAVEADAAPAPRPIPPFEPNLPEGLPGVISGIDQVGSLLLIDRTRSAPVETPLGLVPTVDGATTRLVFDGGSIVDLTADVLVRDELLVVDADQDVLRDSFNLGRLSPDRPGGLLVVETSGTQVVATWSPVGASAGGEDGAGDDDGADSEDLAEFVAAPQQPLSWTIPSPGVDVVGVWGDELLLRRANRIWLLSTDGGTRPVGDGQLLAYDGRHLARLTCDRIGVCALAVGSPDAPNARTLDLPEWLERAADRLWTPTVSISPDGTRLAMAGPNGGISSPLVVDLETGVATPLADGINRDAATAWSPDGRWLAYVYTDDVMVWSLDEGRSWRITLNRQLDDLLWR